MLAKNEHAALKAAEQSKASYQELNAMQVQQAALRSQLSRVEANVDQSADLTSKILQAKADGTASRTDAKEADFLKAENETLRGQVEKLTKQILVTQSPNLPSHLKDVKSSLTSTKS